MIVLRDFERDVDVINRSLTKRLRIVLISLNAAASKNNEQDERLNDIDAIG